MKRSRLAAGVVLGFLVYMLANVASAFAAGLLRYLTPSVTVANLVRIALLVPGALVAGAISAVIAQAASPREGALAGVCILIPGSALALASLASLLIREGGFPPSAFLLMYLALLFASLAMVGGLAAVGGWKAASMKNRPSLPA